MDLRDLGPLRFVAVDEDGRRFPCACHTEPAAWYLISVRPHPANDKIPYVIIPVTSHLNWPARLHNAALTLRWLWDHPDGDDLISRYIVGSEVEALAEFASEENQPDGIA